jgi:hypothetical protein
MKGLPMKDKMVVLEQIAITNMYQLEAMINLLERKRLLTNQELMEELIAVVEKREMRDLIDHKAKANPLQNLVRFNLSRSSKFMP